MAKTSNIQMYSSIINNAVELTKGDGKFRTDVLQDYVESELKVRPGEDFIAKALAERFVLIAGVWERRSA